MISMFTVTGRVLKTYVQVGTIDKDTGKKFDDSFKVQIMGEIPLTGGESRFEAIAMTVEDRTLYDELEGKMVRVSLGFFSPAKGQIVYFIPKGSIPEIVENSVISVSKALNPPLGQSSTFPLNNAKTA